MLVIKRLNNFGIRHPGAVVALGSFDGIHLGHRAIIKRLAARAKAAGHDSVVVTFDPHPQQVLAKTKRPFLLTTVEEKQEILDELGVGVMAVIKFSRLVAKLSPEDFIRSVLIKKLGASEIICGHDCGFGAGRRGDIKTLEDMGGKMDFRVTELSSLRSGGGKVSSSTIRELVSAGNMERANKMLGRYYSIRGRVTKGLGLGRQLGYPTANIMIKDRFKLLPGDGVYAAMAGIGGKKYYGMLFIGQRSTIGRKGRTIEFNAFGGKFSFAGKRAEIFPLKYIRPGKKYGSVKELARAIDGDEKRIKGFLNSHFIE
jgi:riboflavin kinase/FMN adenylyltransferase